MVAREQVWPKKRYGRGFLRLFLAGAIIIVITRASGELCTFCFLLTVTLFKIRSKSNAVSN